MRRATRVPQRLDVEVVKTSRRRRSRDQRASLPTMSQPPIQRGVDAKDVSRSTKARTRGCGYRTDLRAEGEPP